MSFEEENFKSNPNFRFQEIVVSKADALSASYNYDCYKDKNGDVILIYGYFDEHLAYEYKFNIRFVNLRTNEEIKALECAKDRILTVRYFKDPETGTDYLISADKKSNVTVYDLSNDYAKILEADLKYEGFIYNCLLMFDKDKIYAVASSIGSNNNTKVIEIKKGTKDNKDLPAIDIQQSKDFNVYSMSYWYNEKAEEGKKHVIIQCGKSKVLLSEYPSNTTYHSIQISDSYPYISGSIVFKNGEKDYLAFSSTYGYVEVVDLAGKTKEHCWETDEVHLYSFVKWNEEYLLLNDCLQRRIIVFDIKEHYKIKSKVLCPEMSYEKFIKKIDHPKYGESILSIGIDWKIKLFVNRNIMKSGE